MLFFFTIRDCRYLFWNSDISPYTGIDGIRFWNTVWSKILETAMNWNDFNQLTWIRDVFTQCRRENKRKLIEMPHYTQKRVQG